MTALSPVPTERFALPHPSGEGELQIAVARPATPPGDGQAAPVLFVLDGDVGFSFVAELVRFMSMGGRLRPAFVVGIGYGADFAEFARRRTPDLTPPPRQPDAATPEALANFIGSASGGADAFLAFLTDTLAPAIARRFPEASGERFLFGHSLAGLLAAYALLTRPESFAGFVISSPSLWWDDFAALARLDGLPARLRDSQSRPRVLVAVGGQEQDRPAEAPPAMGMDLATLQAFVAACRMVDAAAEFAHALRAAGLAQVDHVRFDGEDHATVVAPAFTRGLEMALKPGWSPSGA